MTGRITSLAKFVADSTGGEGRGDIFCRIPVDKTRRVDLFSSPTSLAVPFVEGC
jgi:hypothetical protein